MKKGRMRRKTKRARKTTEPNDDKELCYFSAGNNKCSILSTPCTGTRSKQLCSFRKTEREFKEDWDRAIQINKAKGNCVYCKYRSERCGIDKEEEKDDFVSEKS